MRSWLVVVVLGSLSGCLWGDSPEEQLQADQGAYEDGDEEHRPGQPCLVCHGADYSPGGDIFVLAGTIFEFADDSDENGLEGATVTVTDSDGREFTAITNTAGNFMVQVDPALSQPRQRPRGRLTIGFQPKFPLRVSVAYGSTEQEMESRIWRNGACAHCHRGATASAEQVEKVWVYEQ